MIQSTILRVAQRLASNIPIELLINTTINPNDLDNIEKFGNPKCRFTGSGHVMYTDGIFVSSEKSSMNAASENSTSIRCVTPIWTWGASEIKLDLTLNGFDYSGNI